MRYFALLLLLFLLAACSQESALSSSDEEHLVQISNALLPSAPDGLTNSQVEALACMKDLAEKTSNWTLASDDDLKEYTGCLTAFYGTKADSYLDDFNDAMDEMSSKGLSLGAEPPSEAKKAKMQEWLVSRNGGITFKWDYETGNLKSAFGALSSQLPLDLGIAKPLLEQELLPIISGLCEFSDDSIWVEDSFAQPCDDCSWQIHYSRFADGIRVASDYLEITFGVDPVNQAAVRATFVDLRCHVDPSTLIEALPNTQLCTIKTVVSTFLDVATDSLSVVECELKYDFYSNIPHLVWDALVRVNGSDALYVTVDANSGDLLKAIDSSANGTSLYSGLVQANIRKPYSSGSTLGALAYSEMSSEDDGSCDSFYDDPTDENGEYYNVEMEDVPGEETVFYSCLMGPYVENRLEYENYASEFECVAGGTCALGLFTAEKDQKRVETFYYLNYANLFAKAGYASIWLYEPLGFLIPYDVVFDYELQNGDGCNGMSNVGYIEYQGWCDGQSELKEEKFRFFVFHEFGHTFLNSSGYWNQAYGELGGAWKEAQADFASYLINRYELLRLAGLGVNAGCGPDDVALPGETDDFYPDDEMDQDYCQGHYHDTGNIIAGVYVDLALELGWKNAFIRVFESIDEISGTNLWSSSVNSFYDEMIETDAGLKRGKSWHMTIAKAWMRHAGAGYLGGVSWYDQWPDEPFPCYMIPIDSTLTTVSDGPDAEMPDLELDMSYDKDYFWFYVYAGESYHFETTGLCTNLDTYMRYIKIQNGVEVTIAYNDECNNVGPNSCIDIVQESSNGWRAIEIHQPDGQPPSPGCYDLEVYSDDDIGDNSSNAKAIAPNNAWYTAAWEDEGDVDYFKVYVKTAGSDMTLNIETCEVATGAAPDTYIKLYYQGGVLPVDTDDNSGTCSASASYISYQVPAGDTGFYFIRVSESGDNAEGSYKIRAYLTGSGRLVRDVGGSTKASAFLVNDSAYYGRYIAADFESGTDEDWFKVLLYENEHVTFHTVDLGLSTDTVMEIWDDEITGYQYIPDSSKKWMRKDDDGGYEAKSSQLHFVAPIAGYYYVRLYPKTASSTGEYTLFVQRLGIYEDDYPEYP